MSEHKTVLISGASRGLGAEAAFAVAKLGANLVLTARSQEGLEKTAARISKLNKGLEVSIFPGDLTDNGFCLQLAASVESLGGLDALILNAAQVEPIGFLGRTDDAEWTAAIELNLLAPSRLARYLLPYLVTSRGCLITVGTGAASSPIASWSAYCASKAALLMLTRVIAAEYPQITALSLAPGVVDTVMQRTIRESHQLMPAQIADYFNNLHSQGQLVHPQVPGQCLAWVALNANHGWSGMELNASDPELMKMVAAGFSDI